MLGVRKRSLWGSRLCCGLCGHIGLAEFGLVPQRSLPLPAGGLIMLSTRQLWIFFGIFGGMLNFPQVSQEVQLLLSPPNPNPNPQEGPPDQRGWGGGGVSSFHCKFPGNVGMPLVITDPHHLQSTDSLR